MTDPVKTLQHIFERELKRLDGISRTEGLDIKSVKELETLVKAYSNFKSQSIPVDDSELDSLPTEELEASLYGEDPETKDGGAEG